MQTVLTGLAYVHNKSQGRYRLLYKGRNEATLEDVAIYQCMTLGHVWVRPWAEFMDGRFTLIKATTDAIPQGQHNPPGN